MKTNPSTGELTLESGIALSPDLSRSAFLFSADGGRAKVLVKNEPWCSYRLDEKEESLSVSIFFEGEKLESIHLAIVTSEFGLGWEDWSEEKELKRKLANERWLVSKNLIAGKGYSWGTVSSDYDQKSGSSAIVVRYKHSS